jgi:PAS domain-containing protein
MALLSHGLGNREIGERLGISEQAVKEIVSRLLAKFGVRNRAGLVRAAIAATPAARDVSGSSGELADAGIVVFDADGHILFMNDRGAELAGTFHGGKSLRQQMDHYDVRDVSGRVLEPHETPVGRALAGETVLDARFLIRRPGEADDTVLRTNVSPLRGSHGRITGAVSLFWHEPKTTT